MKMFHLYLLVFLVSGCASGTQKLEKIDSGMSFAEVNEIMGRRDSFKKTQEGDNSFTLYKYTNHLCNGHVSMYDKCDFFVIFKNGEVVETGVTSVRNNNPNMMFMYLFK